MHYDLYLSFFLFFLLGAICNAFIRMMLDHRADKQRERDEVINSIKSEIRELKHEILKVRF